MSSGRGTEGPPEAKAGGPERETGASAGEARGPGSPFLQAQAPLQTSGHGLIANAPQIKELTEEW